MVSYPRLAVVPARNAVAVVFALNGFAFASWVSRIPEARLALGLTPGRLGTLLLALSVGAVVALPSTGMWVRRFGPAPVVAVAAVVGSVGLAVAGAGAGLVADPWVTACGLLLLGFGSGMWDVAMNVEGASVERALRRSVMPRFHAAFSLGTVAGAAAGAFAAGNRLPVHAHHAAAAVLVALVTVPTVRWFLPAREEGLRRHSRATQAWTEPRTVTLGLLVLALALTEGVANDWLALALVEGHGVPAWAGAGGFALFVAAMTAGRLAGSLVLDRFGRLSVLWGTMVLAAVGVLLVVLVPWLPIVAAGIVLWGVGASLGFPVGMTAAADEPGHAAERVSVVSTIGYTAFLAGPPLMGYVGDQVGVLHALLLVALLLVPSALAVPAARPPAEGAARPPR